MMESPHMLSTRRMCRNLWEVGEESQKKEAAEILLRASYYELSSKNPNNQLWT
jgi:hypothetical protein